MIARPESTAAAVALNRFGLGARPGEALPLDPRGWLLAQLDRYEALPAAWQAVQRTPELLGILAAEKRALGQAPDGERAAVRQRYAKQTRAAYVAAVGARTASALQTAAPFPERLVHFWANHFAVSVDKQAIVGLAGAFEADAIRPHVLGRFEDMLLAAVRHPAMLLYLDQARSIGPDSLAGMRSARRQKPRGLNENLAREILELHTLGVRSGYGQEDVTEFARALTGWTVDEDAGTTPDASAFRFAPALHEPGPRRVLGRTYDQSGEAQARAILHDLAVAPATARHVAGKLARHFAGDEPPPALVQRLADTFTRTGGDLAAVARELVPAPEPWQAGAAKFKSPWDWTISALRALGRRDMPAQQAANLLAQLGQPTWRPGAPAGYGDVAATWAAPDALVRRVEAAQRFAALAARDLDARLLAPQLLPGSLGGATARAIAQSESPATALALLLAAPEFLRR